MAHKADSAGCVTLFLSGDVMIGRGIDQVLTHACDPVIHEDVCRSAFDYVRLAERANGPIPKPVSPDYVWGEALAELDRAAPDLRLINLETSITISEDWVPKGINYRMNPANADVLAAARIDGAVLANNHTLDWGVAGLVETLDTLTRLNVKAIGAGSTSADAEAPAVFQVPGGRVIVFAFGHSSSGVPERWAARAKRPGLNVITELNLGAVDDLAQRVEAIREPGDIVIVSLHWGGNWGYDIPEAQRTFAHAVIEQAHADLVWGHSSHHPKAMEMHHGKLILYGCGDLINDYEGITGRERYRGDLALLYLPTLSMADGSLLRLRMVPMRIRHFRLTRADQADARWLCKRLDQEGWGTGAQLHLDTHNDLTCSVGGHTSALE